MVCMWIEQDDRYMLWSSLFGGTDDGAGGGEQVQKIGFIEGFRALVSDSRLNAGAGSYGLLKLAGSRTCRSTPGVCKGVMELILELKTMELCRAR